MSPTIPTENIRRSRWGRPPSLSNGRGKTNPGTPGGGARLGEPPRPSLGTRPLEADPLGGGRPRPEIDRIFDFRICNFIYFIVCDLVGCDRCCGGGPRGLGGGVPVVQAELAGGDPGGTGRHHLRPSREVRSVSAR